jgi:chitin-binding protein
MKQNYNAKSTFAKLSIAIWLLTLPNSVFGHGTMLVPESRIYKCRFGDNPDNPQDPACRAAVQINGAQMPYNWNGINQANAAGNSRTLIPDGQLCGGGRTEFSGLNLARTDWRPTPIQSGYFEFQFYPTAPHATKDVTFYITPVGWNPLSPLRWADMTEFCKQGSTPLVAGAQGKSVYKLGCTLPARTGQHVIYSVWQRSDSTEAFYACNDVQFSGGTPPGPAPSFIQSGIINNTQDLPVGTQLSFRVFDDTGADLEKITVTLATGQSGSTLWPYVLGSAVNSQSINARIGTQDAAGNITPTQLLNGNSVFLASGKTLKYAIDTVLPPPPLGGLTTKLTMTSDWVTGYCANVDVKNNGALVAQWQVSMAIQGTVTSLWNGVYTQSGTTINVKGAGWNNSLPAGGTVQFGFCANR